MALIVDPDLLADSATDDASQEAYISTSAKTIKLTVVGNLSTDGVTLKALYSYLKEQWKNDPLSKNLAAFQFPMVPITDESYEFVGGWDLANDASRYLIRTAGWTVRNVAGAATQMWAGCVGLGSIESNDQLYYWQGGATTPTNFQLQGQVNQAVQIFKDDDGDGITAEGSDFDLRTSLTLYVREQGQLFGQASLADIGVTTMQAIAYRFPISTGADLKIVAADTAIKASGSGYPADTAPYDGMSITYHATPQARALQGGSYNFGVIVDGNGQTLQKVYEFIQYALRQNADIDADAGSVTGKIAKALARYVGDTMYTNASDNDQGGGTGVFIDDFSTADVNGVYFTDNTGASRNFAYVATVTFNFNDNLVNDGSAKWWAYFSDLTAVARSVADAGITAADGTLTSATAAFVAGDKDTLVRIAGAGTAGAAHFARIVSVTNGTTVEVTPNAVTTVSGAALDIYGNDWGMSGAVIVDDATPADMTGTITATPVTKTFDYDGNTQGGRTAGTDAAITVVAIGLATGQYVKATGTIERSKSNSVSLVAPLERNYLNP